MQLTDLPGEILFIIFHGFDLRTVESLYNTCSRFREIVCMQGMIKQVNMSCNVMASVNTLKQKFFKDLSQHMSVLNMCGVPDLCKTALLPTLKKLTKLKELDVSYTKIKIIDLISIHEMCPTLKNITINFVLCNKLDIVPNASLLQCQSIFEHFESVHFVGSIENLLCSKLGVFLLSKANLHSLKYTIAINNDIIYSVSQDLTEQSVFPHFHKFSVYKMNWNYKKSFPDMMLMNDSPVLSMLNLQMYEYIVINVMDFEPKVYASQIFNDFFKENFKIKLIEDIPIPILTNAAIMMWSKESTSFDNSFFHKLLKQIKQYFPVFFVHKHPELEQNISTNYDWYYTIPTVLVYNEQKVDLSKKRRLAAPNYVLNYDEVFKDKKQVEFSLDFRYPANNPIALSSSCNYLRKLTYLSLTHFGRYAADFFNILFRTCDNLITLNIETLSISPSASAISRSVPLSRSLKNIRIVDKRIDFVTLFWSFSQCQTLENIHIVDDTVIKNNNLGIPTLILEKCINLYSVYVEALLTPKVRRQTELMFNKAKASSNKHHVNVKVQHLKLSNEYSYDPFVDVFKLNPIKPVK